VKGCSFSMGFNQMSTESELKKLILNGRGRRVESVPNLRCLLLSLHTRNMFYRRSSGSCEIVTSDIRLTNKIERFCVCLVS